MSSTFQCWEIHEHCPHMSTPATANGVWRSAATDSLLCEDRVRVGSHQRVDVSEYDEPSPVPPNPWRNGIHRRVTSFTPATLIGTISPATAAAFGIAGPEYRSVPRY